MSKQKTSVDPMFTCGACKKQWTMHGVVDLDELRANWLKCPWCGKILYIPEEEDRES